MHKLRLGILLALMICVIEVMLVSWGRSTGPNSLTSSWTPASAASLIENGLNAPAVVMMAAGDYLWNSSLGLIPGVPQFGVPWSVEFRFVCVLAWWFFLGVCFAQTRSKTDDKSSIPAWVTLLGSLLLLNMTFKLGGWALFKTYVSAPEAISKAFWETWTLLAAFLSVLLFSRGIQSIRRDSRHRVDVSQGIVSPWIAVIALSILMAFCAGDLLAFRHVQVERQQNGPKTFDIE